MNAEIQGLKGYPEKLDNGKKGQVGTRVIPLY
jgi:hypothetical protein